MDLSEEVLFRKRLEWELSLSWTDIRSNAWFHGSISRSKADDLLVSCGHFLVRNCSSRPDEYVLSTRSDGHVLHFVISRVVLQANTTYETIRYTFEDDYFDSISDLITFYVGNRRPVSRASMAVITTPVNRTKPLTDLQFYKNKVNNNLVEMKYNSETIESYLSEDNRRSGCSPPPKPSRIPIQMTTNSSADEMNVLIDEKLSNISLNCDNLSESSGHSSQRNGSEDSAFFSENVSPKQTEENKYEIKIVPKIEDNFDSEPIETTIETTITPQIFSSIIKAQSFQTYLLTKDNKPLETTAIIKIQSVLLSTGPRILANHLAKCDLEFIRLLDVDHCYGLGIYSALELILVPIGQQMRIDLLERHKCLKYFVCITLLTAINDENRALILNKWIEIAIEVKTALGDLFGFAAIMEALSMETIFKLKTCWALLRKDFTKNAITYETKLRPQLKSMTECTEPQAPNTTFPFILTLIQILERHSKIMSEKEKTNEKCLSKQSDCLNLWFEQTSVDCGLQQIFSHLEFGSELAEQLANYRRNAHIVLDDVQYEELLCDMFRTEFHRQFLFGFRGSDVESDEKFDKFDKILMALVRKCEPDLQCLD